MNCFGDENRVMIIMMKDHHHHRNRIINVLLLRAAHIPIYVNIKN